MIRWLRSLWPKYGITYSVEREWEEVLADRWKYRRWHK